MISLGNPECKILCIPCPHLRHSNNGVRQVTSRFVFMGLKYFACLAYLFWTGLPIIPLAFRDKRNYHELLSCLACKVFSIKETQQDESTLWPQMLLRILQAHTEKKFRQDSMFFRANSTDVLEETNLFCAFCHPISTGEAMQRGKFWYSLSFQWHFKKVRLGGSSFQYSSSHHKWGKWATYFLQAADTWSGTAYLTSIIIISVSLSFTSLNGARPHTSIYRITPRLQMSENEKHGKHLDA